MESFLEIAPGEIAKRVFAVGDVHGCPDELQSLLEFIQNEQALTTDDQVIFIGDYVDRGPDSKSVVDYLIQFQKRFPKSIFLKGNHEDMLLAYLGFEGTQGYDYINNGGAKCLESYGLKRASNSEEVLQAFPKQHLSFFLNLTRYVIMGDFVFSHAGLHPLRDLRAQLDRDLYWIRDEFISNIHHFEKTVIFGHTPYKDVMFHAPYKIGIDTGLVYGNKLSAIELSLKEIYQIQRKSSKVIRSTFPIA